jgi:enamine deaminase RidA (YjgF/YER057c/UK114 family)
MAKRLAAMQSCRQNQPGKRKIVIHPHVTHNPRSVCMSRVTRHLSDAQFSRIVTHGDVVHLAGQPAKDRSAPVKAQTAEVLRSIDALLAQAGTNKSRLLTAIIYLADMRQKAQMDEAWLEWVDPENPPSRACVETRLGNLGSEVMIRVVAAL